MGLLVPSSGFDERLGSRCVYRGTRGPGGKAGVTVRYDVDIVDKSTGKRLGRTARTGALAPRLDLMNHSPSGFEWGYAGSGPAQLALAVLADHMKRFPEDYTLLLRIAKLPDVCETCAGTHAIDEEPCPECRASDGARSTPSLVVRAHQAFKGAMIARLPRDSFEFDSGEVREALRLLAERRS